MSSTNRFVKVRAVTAVTLLTAANQIPPAPHFQHLFTDSSAIRYTSSDVRLTAACGCCENGRTEARTFPRVVERYYVCAFTVKLDSKERLVLLCLQSY